MSTPDPKAEKLTQLIRDAHWEAIEVAPHLPFEQTSTLADAVELLCTEVDDLDHPGLDRQVKESHGLAASRLRAIYNYSVAKADGDLAIIVGEAVLDAQNLSEALAIITDEYCLVGEEVDAAINSPGATRSLLDDLARLEIGLRVVEESLPQEGSNQRSEANKRATILKMLPMLELYFGNFKNSQLTNGKNGKKFVGVEITSRDIAVARLGVRTTFAGESYRPINTEWLLTWKIDKFQWLKLQGQTPSRGLWQ